MLETFLVSFHDSSFPLAPQIFMFPRFFPWLFYLSKLSGQHVYSLEWDAHLHVDNTYISIYNSRLPRSGRHPVPVAHFGTSGWIILCLHVSSFHSELLHSELCWTKCRRGVKQYGSLSSKNLFCMQKKVGDCSQKEIFKNFESETVLVMIRPRVLLPKGRSVYQCISITWEIAEMRSPSALPLRPIE